jgi:Mlc titration factor MtfA (ptsG expression regulator)
VFARIRQWQRSRVLARHAIDDALWRDTFGQFAFLASLGDPATQRLRELATLFLAEKAISAAGGHEVTAPMRVSIAIQACLLVLELGLDYYDGWSEIIVYPDTFLPEHTWTDEAGVVHQGRVARAGEAWLRGPVVLSWADVARAGDADGANVVIHEFAHKLDMLDGAANGCPPLHRGMRREAWAAAFSDAFERFSLQVRRHRYTEIDPYAAESPAEFFAVLSEAFFEIPHIVALDYPAVYEQLRQFYRQDPLARLGFPMPPVADEASGREPHLTLAG